MKMVLLAEVRRMCKYLWFLPVLMLLQVAVITVSEHYRYGGFVTPEQYRSITRDVTDGNLSIEDIRARNNDLNKFLHGYGNGDVDVPQFHYTGNYFTEEYLLKHILSEVESTEQYQVYLQEIQNAAKRLTSASIFNTTDGYAQRVIIKTAEQYAELSGITLHWSDSAGVRIALQPEGVGWISFFGLLIFVVPLIHGTRQTDSLLRTTLKGRRPLLTARLVCSATFALLLTASLTLVAVLYASLYYGLGDLSRPLQSAFTAAPWALTAGGAVIVLAGLRCLMLLALAFFVTILFNKLHSMLTAFVVLAVALSVGMLWYTAIPVYSRFNVFKWVNLYGLLNPDDMILQYQCVNLFGQPVQLVSVMCITCIVLAVFFCAWAIYAVDQSAIDKTCRIINKMPTRNREYSSRVFIHEIWRLLWGYKIAIILLGLAVVALLRCNYIIPRYYPDEVEYHKIIQILVDIPEKERQLWITSQLEMESSHWRDTALHRANEHLQHLSDHPLGELFYDTGWQHLLGLNDQARDEYTVSMLMLLVGISLCVAPVREQYMLDLLCTTKLGRSFLTRRKYILSWLVGIAAALSAFFPNLWHSLRLFGLPNAASMALSLPAMGTAEIPLYIVGITYLLVISFISIIIATIIHIFSRFGLYVALAAGTAIMFGYIIIVI